MMEKASFRNWSPLVLLLIPGVFLTGCSTGRAVRPAEFMPVPRATREVAREAVSQALLQIDLPPGGDRELAVQCTGDTAGVAFETAGTVFSRAGYRITRSTAGFPRLIIRIDSLVVTVKEMYAPLPRGSAEREVAVKLTVEYQERDGLSQVFHTTGSARDQVPAGMFEADRAGQSLEERNRNGRSLPAMVKPAALALFMTILVWSLYSYRG